MQLPFDEDSERSRDGVSMSTHGDELSLHLREEPVADRGESLLWPLVEPVYGGAVHYGWELPATDTEGRTHR